MFTMYKILSFTIISLFLLTMTLLPMYSSMVVVKSVKASQEKPSMNVPDFEGDVPASYY